MGTGDQFDGVEAGPVHAFGHRQHHARGHVFRPQALMAIANSRIDESYTVSAHFFKVLKNVEIDHEGHEGHEGV
jgi:hypothetical protein